MAGKKNSEKKEEMIKVNLAEIDRKRMEYRWGMESFFRNHKIEAENYKEALERYRESCLVLMPESDIKKIEDTKKIKVKRIPFINLHKIRREKPLGRWQARACFKNCEINENRYKKELEAYNQACRLQMKPKEIAAIAEKLPCDVSDFSNSENTVDLFKIRNKMNEKTLKEFFVKCGIDIEKYKNELYKQASVMQENLEEIKKNAEKMKTILKKLEDIQQKLNLLNIDSSDKKPIEALVVECEAEINEYEDEIYKQAIILKMEPEELKVIAEKLPCSVSKFAFSNEIVDLSEIRRRLEETALKEIFAEWGIEINKDAEETGAQGRYFNASLKEVRRIEKELNCCEKEFLKSESLGEYTVDLSKVKQRIEKNILKWFFEKYGMNTDEYDQAIQAYEKSGFIKAEKADIKKIEQNMKLQENKFIENAVDLSDIQRRLKVHEPGDIEQNLKNYGIEIQKYEEELKTYEEASYLTMEEDDIEKLAKSLQCKREEIEIKQKSVNLLQVEAKIEKIAREKWSTLEDFFESIGVNRDYQKEIEQYENQHFIECNKNLFDKLVEGFECGEKDLLFVGNKGGNQEIYKVKIVELERRKKTKDGEWRESLYDTLKVKKILDGVSKEESNRIKGDIKKFAADSFIDMDEYDCKKISNSINCEMVEIINGEVPVDLRKIPGLDMGNTSHPTKILGLTSSYKIENSGFSGKIKEASEKGIHCVNMKLSTANQIAKSSGYKLEDLQASAFDIAKDEVKKKLLPFARQVKMDVLRELFMLEYEQWLWENSRIEYLKTESGYNVTIFFYGEKYEITDLPKTDQEEDIEQYLVDELEKCLSDGYPDELYALFSELPIVEVEERKNGHPFFSGKCEQLLNRMDADGESLENKWRVLRNEMPFTQDMCDYYEIPNPFDIEE